MGNTAFFIKYLPMKIALQSIKTAELPEYLGSTLRGTIGQALYYDFDAFRYLYNNRALSGNQKDIVNPYMIIPPAGCQTVYQPGEELVFHAILMGDAEQYAFSVVEAVSKIYEYGLGALRYPFALTKVTHSLDQRVIWQDGIFYDVAAQSVVLPYRNLPDVKQLTVHLKTPLRIRRNGALLETIDFPTIIRNVTRRAETIAARYGGWADAEEIERIKKLSTKVAILRQNVKLKEMKRYSNRMGESMDFGGLIGSAQFEGDLTPFVPWIYAAQILHIGRNTTFGMGQIEAEFI